MGSGREFMFANEADLGRRSGEYQMAQQAREYRARWEGWAFQEVDLADLPEGDEEVYFATVDAALASGLVRAGTFFRVAPGSKFEPSRTFLAASRPALERLKALRDELVRAGQHAKASQVDLRPVRPQGGVEERAAKPRLADGSATP